MHGRRLTATAMGLGMLALAACSSSGAKDGATTTSSTVAAAGATTSTAPATTVATLSDAGRKAADTLTSTSGFRADQSACMVSVVVKSVGETDGLPLFGEASGELSTAQQDALVSAFEGCLSTDERGALVGVTVQAAAAEVGANMGRQQIACAGTALIEAHTLRSLLFDEGLIDRVFADGKTLEGLLATCVGPEMATSVARGAAEGSQERLAQRAARNALTAAKTWASDSGSYAGITQAALTSESPDYTFVPNAGPSTGPTEVSWQLTGTTLTLAVRSANGACYALRDDLDDEGTIAKGLYGKVAAPAADRAGPAQACTAASVPPAAFTDTW